MVAINRNYGKQPRKQTTQMGRTKEQKYRPVGKLVALEVIVQSGLSVGELGIVGVINSKYH